MAENGDEEPLSRPQRRLLRRLYNGRTSPLVAADMPFLTYQEAKCYLHGLPVDAREAVIAEMNAHATAHATGK